MAGVCTAQSPRGSTRWLVALQLVCLCVLCSRPAAAGLLHSQEASLTSSQLETPAASSKPLPAPSPPSSQLPAPTTSHVAAGGAKGTAHVAAAAQQPPSPKLTGKTSLLPLDRLDFALMAVIMFSLSLAGGAGIGGGAILVPVYLMLRGWPTAIAVALSNVTILGGSFANFICNVGRHRPNGKRTIDWELILMMEPTTIVGALVGAVANKLLPNWFITYLLAILLTLMGLRLYSKGKQTYKKETQLLLAAKAAAKERRRLLSAASFLRLASGEQAGATGGAAAAAPAGAVEVPARTLWPSSRSSILGSSFSRLRDSVVVAGLEPGTSLPGRAPTPSGRSLLSPTGRHSLRAPAEDVAPDETGGFDQQAAGQAVGSYMCSTLFQGDAPDGCEPVVALPPNEDLSSSSSDDFGNDVEEGPGEAGDHALLQPLLLPDSAAHDGDDLLHHQDQGPAGASGHITAADKEWGVRSTQAAPDLTIQLEGAAATPKAPSPEPSLPWAHFLSLLGLSAWVVAADISQDSFRCGSWQYWASQLSVLVPVVIILGVCRQVLLRKYQHDDVPAGTQLPEGELHWTRRTTILYPLLCSTAGLIAGLFGIGGGVVKGPLMLELGVPADVAAATSATMIMFTAGSACLVYSRFGQILYDYAVVLVLLGFTVTLCSQLLTFLLIKLLGRRSVIIFMMVALMGAASGIMYVQSGLVTADLVRHPEDLWKFGSLCPTDRQPNLLMQLGQMVLARLQ